MNPLETKKRFVQEILSNAKSAKADSVRARYAPPSPEREMAPAPSERPDPVGDAEPLSDEDLQRLLQSIGE
jgi:hypothetical protein